MKTVSELIAELQKYPGDMKVVLASDEEGNDFHGWYDVGYGRWSDLDKAFTSWTYDDDLDESSERALTLDESDAICLWP